MIIDINDIKLIIKINCKQYNSMRYEFVCSSNSNCFFFVTAYNNEIF